MEQRKQGRNKYKERAWWEKVDGGKKKNRNIKI